MKIDLIYLISITYDNKIIKEFVNKYVESQDS